MRQKTNTTSEYETARRMLELRDITKLPLQDCRAALTKNDGNIDKAYQELQLGCHSESTKNTFGSNELLD